MTWDEGFARRCTPRVRTDASGSRFTCTGFPLLGCRLRSAGGSTRYVGTLVSFLSLSSLPAKCDESALKSEGLTTECPLFRKTACLPPRNPIPDTRNCNVVGYYIEGSTKGASAVTARLGTGILREICLWMVRAI